MPPRPVPSLLPRAAALGLAVLAVTACAGPVEVARAPLADDAACQGMTDLWPALDGLERVETDPDDPTVAAWGDPAIVARCGVRPLGPTTEACITVDGVDWVAGELSDGTRLTTYGRTPAIEVLVPHAHDPAPMLLPAFAGAAEQLPRNGRECV